MNGIDSRFGKKKKDPENEDAFGMVFKSAEFSQKATKQNQKFETTMSDDLSSVSHDNKRTVIIKRKIFVDKYGIKLPDKVAEPANVPTNTTKRGLSMDFRPLSRPNTLQGPSLKNAL